MLYSWGRVLQVEQCYIAGVGTTGRTVLYSWGKVLQVEQCYIAGVGYYR